MTWDEKAQDYEIVRAIKADKRRANIGCYLFTVLLQDGYFSGSDVVLHVYIYLFVQVAPDILELIE